MIQIKHPAAAMCQQLRYRIFRGAPVIAKHRVNPRSIQRGAKNHHRHTFGGVQDRLVQCRIVLHQAGAHQNQPIHALVQQQIQHVLPVLRVPAAAQQAIVSMVPQKRFQVRHGLR